MICRISALEVKFWLRFYSYLVSGDFMTDEIIQAISTYIATSILKQPKRSLAADTALLSSGLVDSFSLVDLALFIEETFGVTLEDTELNTQTFDTLGQLADVIAERRDHHTRR